MSRDPRFAARTRIDGKRGDAILGYAGAPLTLTTGVELFSTVDAQTGRDDHQESISTGARLRF